MIVKSSFAGKIDTIGFDSFLREEKIRQVIRSQYSSGEFVGTKRYSFHKKKFGWFSKKYEEFLSVSQYDKAIYVYGYCKTADMIIQFLKRLNIVNDEYTINLCNDYPIVRSKYEI